MDTKQMKIQKRKKNLFCVFFLRVKERRNTNEIFNPVFELRIQREDEVTEQIRYVRNKDKEE